VKETLLDEVLAVVSRKCVLLKKERRNDGVDEVKFPCLEAVGSWRGRGA
jgi:hypothetical protein